MMKNFSKGVEGLRLYDFEGREESFVMPYGGSCKAYNYYQGFQPGLGPLGL